MVCYAFPLDRKYHSANSFTVSRVAGKSKSVTHITYYTHIELLIRRCAAASIFVDIFCVLILYIVKAITCETTVEQLCPYEKPSRHCPRFELYCTYCLTTKYISSLWYPVLFSGFVKTWNYCIFRLYCPRNCLEENPRLSRVIGTKIYSDVSSCFSEDV